MKQIIFFLILLVCIPVIYASNLTLSDTTKFVFVEPSNIYLEGIKITNNDINNFSISPLCDGECCKYLSYSEQSLLENQSIKDWGFTIKIPSLINETSRCLITFSTNTTLFIGLNQNNRIFDKVISVLNQNIQFESITGQGNPLIIHRYKLLLLISVILILVCTLIIYLLSQNIFISLSISILVTLVGNSLYLLKLIL